MIRLYLILKLFQEQIKGSCRSWGDLSSISLGNMPQLRQLPLMIMVKNDNTKCTVDTHFRPIES